MGELEALMPAINQAGTDAVLLYRRMAKPQDDNEVPERFVSSHLAANLHARLDGGTVDVECPYTLLIEQLGLEIPRDRRQRIWLRTADVVIFQEQRPRAIVEVKIYDELCSVYSIVDDLGKDELLLHGAPVSKIVAVMVCETRNKDLAERVEKFREAVHGVAQSFDLGMVQECPKLTGSWKWRFACAAN